jgi:hypothetical protein
LSEGFEVDTPAVDAAPTAPTGRRKTGPRRTPAQRDHDRREIARLVVGGKSQREVAAITGLSTGQVCIDLTTARREWTAAMIEDLDAVTREELRRLDDVEAKASAGYEASKDADHPGGDPRFLDVAVKVQQRRSRLLGLDAAAQVNVRSGALRVNVPNPGGDPQADARRTAAWLTQFGALSDEQFGARLRAMLSLEAEAGSPVDTASDTDASDPTD